MVFSFKLDKASLGKLLVPEKIFSFPYSEELKRVTSMVYYDKVNYLIIANLFFLSEVFSVLIFMYLYQYLVIFFKELFLFSAFNRFVYIFIIYFLISYFIYIIFLFFYFFIINSKYRKATLEIEKDLPEFLDSLVSNLKGGISLEKSLLKSVRPEQVALRKEVTLMNERILMGSTALDAILEFKKRYPDSEILSRTLFLIIEGVKSGGNLAKPLERISQNLKTIYSLNDEVKASSSGFVIVIRMISVLVSPLLFALAITLLTFISNLFSLLSEAETGFFSTITEIPSDYKFYLIIFSYSMIFLITFFSSLIISHLKNEKPHEFIKYLPVSIVIALLIYNLSKGILLGFFGNII